MSKVFGIVQAGRQLVPDSKRETGFSIEEPDRRDMNEILYKIIEDWRVGTESQVIANEANVWFDSSVPEFKNKAGATVTFLAGETIAWLDLDILADDIDTSAIDDLNHTMVQGSTLSLGIYNLKLGSNQTGFLTATSSPTDETEGNISADNSPELVVNNNRTEKLKEFETKNLIISNASVSTSDVTADYIRLLDNNNNAFPLGAISEVFNMATDLNAGTEKASTRYNYWVGCDYLGNVERKIVPDLIGTADGTASGFLVDSGNTFFTDKVIAGDIVKNTSTLLETTVLTTPTSDGANLDITGDIFLSGNNYEINIETPQFDASKIFKAKLGSENNDAGSDLTDDIYYTQGRKVKQYTGQGVNFIISGATYTSGPAVSRVYQIRDGNWMSEYNFAGSMTPTGISVTITLSEIIFSNRSSTFKQAPAVTSANGDKRCDGVILPNSGTVILRSEINTTSWNVTIVAECEQKPEYDK